MKDKYYVDGAFIHSEPAGASIALAQGDTRTESQSTAALIAKALNQHDNLVNVMWRLLVDHQMMDPHHNDGCQLCQDGTQALRDAGIEL